MSKTMIGLAAATVLLGLGGLLLFASYASANNEEVRLRTAVEAQQQQAGNVLDSMWKNFREIAGIPDRERETAVAMFVEYADARTPEGGGKLMTWVQEQAPAPLTPKLYQDLMDRLTAGRQEFRESQKYLLDLKRQHDTLCRQIPSCWFLRDASPVEVTLIVSGDTREAMRTGRDDRVLELPERTRR